MATQNFDAIIIGSGQAGNPLATRLANEGKKVALVEGRHFGGTCVNVGCTPTKAYIASARRLWEATHGKELGVIIPAGAQADLRQIKKRKDKIVEESVKSLKALLEKNKKISLIRGKASFTGFKIIEVEGKTYYANQIFINTGARPNIPEGFKNINYLTNESILELEELPEQLLIVGGSYLGLEFAQMFRRFGSKVTIIEKGPSLVNHEDNEVSQAMKEILEDEGIEIILNADCTAATQGERRITLNVDCREKTPELKGSHLLLAVGRIPNTDKLNLKATGLTTDEKGYIEVNDQLETHVQGIYALGDCNGRGAFTHTSYDDFQILVSNMFDGRQRFLSKRIPTYCIYTDPPLARAGITKKQAREKGLNLLQAKLPMTQVNRALEKGETKGFMSAIIDADTLKIIGATVLGTSGDEVIASFLNIMHAGVPYNRVRDVMIPHPTVSELIPTMLGKALKI